ncbi:MAG: sigma-54 interaction domain-containing protein [Anaerovoracaceae bacterium]
MENAASEKRKSQEQLIISDFAMRDIVETIERISFTDSTILITGESGTGKSLLAKYIHNNSKRANNPFVTINCTTIPDSLIESELFGYTQGAFTNASTKGKIGMVKPADKGTLFLDEIGSLPFNMQTKFLQLIQEKSYTPVGAVEQESVDVRIIAATNSNLEEQISKKKFREDLYYRLRVIELEMPPLRNRPDAFDPLVDYYLSLYNKMYNLNRSITIQARNKLKAHSWGGNVRELQYVLERLVVASPSEVIGITDIPPLTKETVVEGEEISKKINFEVAVSNFEKELLEKAFKETASSYGVAEMLEITQSKASRLLRKYGIR